MTLERAIHHPGSQAPRLVSMQSHVAHGHVGNAVAQFVLQRLGCEVVPLHTVLYSSHLGYPEWRGRVRSVEELGELLDGLEAIGALEHQEALLTGFLGDVDHALLALELHATRMPHALMCVDPVMGDHGSLYVHRDLVEVYRTRMLGVVDVLTPNMFELELLTDMPVASVAQASAALEALITAHRNAGITAHAVTSRIEGGPLAVVKGVQDRAFPEHLFVLARHGDEELILRTPRLGGFFAGAGDLFSATLVAKLLLGQHMRAAIEHAIQATFHILEQTRHLGRRELALIPSQAIFDAPLASKAVEVRWLDEAPGGRLVDDF